MLLCQLTGQRCQPLTKLDITQMQELPGKYYLPSGKNQKPLDQGNTTH